MRKLFMLGSARKDTLAGQVLEITRGFEAPIDSSVAQPLDANADGPVDVDYVSKIALLMNRLRRYHSYSVRWSR